MEMCGLSHRNLNRCLKLFEQVGTMVNHNVRAGAVQIGNEVNGRRVRHALDNFLKFWVLALTLNISGAVPCTTFGRGETPISDRRTHDVLPDVRTVARPDHASAGVPGNLVAADADFRGSRTACPCQSGGGK